MSSLSRKATRPCTKSELDLMEALYALATPSPRKDLGKTLRVEDIDVSLPEPLIINKMIRA